MQFPLTLGINRRTFESLKDIFEDDNIHQNLIKIATRLKVPFGRIWICSEYVQIIVLIAVSTIPLLDFLYLMFLIVYIWDRE